MAVLTQIEFLVSGQPFGGATGAETTTVNLRLPAYQLVNLSAGVELANQLDIILYVKNVFDENALQSFDRERGGRARLGFRVGQPRTIGVTVRKGFLIEGTFFWGGACIVRYKRLPARFAPRRACCVNEINIAKK